MNNSIELYFQFTNANNKTTSVPNSIKKAIAKDWINEFPNSLAYTQNKLYKIIGPYVVGIEIFNLPRAEDYCPYFVVHELWDKTLNEFLKDPSVF